MTTIVVVKKGTEIAIASDALVTFGETRLPHGYEMNEKIFKVRDSYIGLAGSTAHFAVFAQALHHLGEEVLLAVAGDLQHLPAPASRAEGALLPQSEGGGQ